MQVKLRRMDLDGIIRSFRATASDAGLHRVDVLRDDRAQSEEAEEVAVDAQPVEERR
jgi:hypothetical protein